MLCRAWRAWRSKNSARKGSPVRLEAPEDAPVVGPALAQPRAGPLRVDLRERRVPGHVKDGRKPQPLAHGEAERDLAQKGPGVAPAELELERLPHVDRVLQEVLPLVRERPRDLDDPFQAPGRAVLDLEAVDGGADPVRSIRRHRRVREQADEETSPRVAELGHREDVVDEAAPEVPVHPGEVMGLTLEVQRVGIRAEGAVVLRHPDAGQALRVPRDTVRGPIDREALELPLDADVRQDLVVGDVEGQVLEVIVGGSSGFPGRPCGTRPSVARPRRAAPRAGRPPPAMLSWAEAAEGAGDSGAAAESARARDATIRSVMVHLPWFNRSRRPARGRRRKPTAR